MPATPPTCTAKQTGCYLYAFVAGLPLGPLDPRGIDGGPVYAVGDQALAAVVSDVPNEKLRPERRRLSAHHEVLKYLLPRGTVLPLAFGIIADDPAALDQILERNREPLREQITHLEGKVEMGLRVVWDVPNIFEYFLGIHPDLRALRDHLFRGEHEPTQNERIDLGRLFDRALSDERQTQTEKVVRALSPHCVEVKENKQRKESEVMNLACLVRREAQKDFERGVFEAAQQFDNHFAFDFNGPWPAHNFVDVNLEM